MKKFSSLERHLKKYETRTWTEFAGSEHYIVTDSFEHGNEPLVTMKDGNFLDQLRLLILETKSVPWSQSVTYLFNKEGTNNSSINTIFRVKQRLQLQSRRIKQESRQE